MIAFIRRHYSAVSGFAAAISVIVLVFVLPTMSASWNSREIAEKPKGVTASGQSSVMFANTSTANKIAQSIDRTHSVGIVRFKTVRFREGELDANGKPSLGLCMTSHSITPDGVPGIRIDGNFSLVQMINLTPPKLGDVSEFILTKSQLKDPAFLRLGPLLECRFHKDPLLYVAIWPKDVSNVLDGTFVGPLAEFDAVQLSMAAKQFKKEAFEDMSMQTAETLLTKEENPFLVWAGMARLKVLGKLNAGHFVKLFHSVPENQIPYAMRALFENALFDAELRKNVPEILLTGKLADSKLKVVLTETAILLRENRCGARQTIDPRRLKSVAGELRKNFEKNPNHKRAVELLDQLVEVVDKF